MVMDVPPLDTLFNREVAAVIIGFHPQNVVLYVLSNLEWLALVKALSSLLVNKMAILNLALGVLEYLLQPDDHGSF